MLVFKFIFLASFMAGSYSMTLECFTKKRLPMCGDYDIKEVEPPKTVEDLRNFCSNIVPIGICISKVYEECAADENFKDDEEDLKYFQHALYFVIMYCTEDHPVFKVVSENLDCISSTIENMDDICIPHSMNDTLHKTLVHLEGENSFCNLDAWFLYCFLARFDVNCGNNVRDAVSKILLNTDVIERFCKDHVVSLSSWEDAFKSEFSQGRSSQDAVEGVLESIMKIQTTYTSNIYETT